MCNGGEGRRGGGGLLCVMEEGDSRSFLSRPDLTCSDSITPAHCVPTCLPPTSCCPHPQGTPRAANTYRQQITQSTHVSIA